ncbi:hypothetical protein C9E81_18255 [Paracoccus alkanivorans]|uniref:Uncharacterized protein n=2 Tax=Paracoccus alkanivorans TaxID=2116655 RepID=A0A3M0M728_9RHOB|nr:hypothetical protein C9E81_18255 [Paracoccus alkanivorans]
MIAYKNTEADGFQSFGKIWLDTAIALDNESAILDKRPWLDQIALPISIERAGWQFNPLDERWNLGVNLIRDKNAINRVNQDDPIIIHYHHHQHMSRFKFKNYLRDLLAEYTCFQNIKSIRKAINSITEGTQKDGECWLNKKHDAQA